MHARHHRCLIPIIIIDGTRSILESATSLGFIIPYVPSLRTMRPRAILRHHSNSYPFEERTLDLTTVVKVGRAVAKCKPQGDNAIFDCKVLSRNHAEIWFENGKVSPLPSNAIPTTIHPMLSMLHQNKRTDSLSFYLSHSKRPNTYINI